MAIICLLLIPVSLLMSLALSACLIGVARLMGQMDEPGREDHKGHDCAVPNTGGSAIFLSVLVPIVAVLTVVWLIPPEAFTGWLSPVADQLSGIRGQTPLAAAILVALAALHVLGVIDDRKSVGIVAKLIVQLTVAAILVGFFGVRIFQFLAHGQFGVVGVVACMLLSTLWIVAITNAMNMLDNMDGLAGGVGTIIAALYLAATLIGQQWFVASMCALLIGALVGFLAFNIPTAKHFMGDGGSLVLGLLLAVISVRTTYVGAGASGVSSLSTGPWYAVLMPLILMAVPLYDLFSVTLIRLRAGHSPLRADQNHLSHRLVRLGLTRRAAVGVIWLTTLATGLGGVMLGRLSDWQALLVACQTIAVLIVLATLEIHGNGQNPIGNDEA